MKRVKLGTDASTHENENNNKISYNFIVHNLFQVLIKINFRQRI